jgi:hypothetical protein
VNKQITFLNSLYKLNNDSNSSLKNHLTNFQKQIDTLEKDLNTIDVLGNETITRQRLKKNFIKEKWIQILVLPYKISTQKKYQLSIFSTLQIPF